jgi:hypothetical protein
VGEVSAIGSLLLADVATALRGLSRAALYRLARALAAVCLACGFVACGSGDSKPSADFRTDSALQRDADRFAKQLASSFTVAGLHDVEVLRQRLVERCIERKGVPLPPSAPPPVDPALLPVITDLELLLNRGEPLGRGAALADASTLQRIRRHETAMANYQSPAWPAEAERYRFGDPPRKLDLTLPGEAGGSITVQLGGCHGEAARTLFGVSAETYERTRLELPRGDVVLDQAIAADPVQASLDDYADCMEARGLKASRPDDLHDVLGPVDAAVIAGREQPSALVDLEARAVRADLACKEASGLGTAFLTAFVDRARSAIRGSEGAVAEHERMLEHARASAKRLSLVN